MITIDVNKKPHNSTNVGIVAEKNSVTKQTDSTCENNDSVTVHGIFTSNHLSTKHIPYSVDYSQSNTSQ
ncbi:MAG: hypothetical protein KGZ37_09230 [Nitrosarchaeum sp.]|nr:hypothetical protein [Nitrosarchaeum sp.]